MLIKYTDINIRFCIGDTSFIVLSISNERFLRSIPNHSHSNNSYEIHYIPYGYGTTKINGTDYDIVPNTLFVTGPNIEHSQIPHSEDPMVEYCIYLKLEKEKSKPLHNLPTDYITVFKKTHFWYGQDTQNLLPIFRQMFYELEKKQTGYQLQITTLLQQCIIQLVRNYESSNKETQPEWNSAHNEPAIFYDKNYLILEECFLYEYPTLTLQKLSARLGLGIRQTERLLKEQYGKTFLQKKNEAKMSAAAILLQDKEKSITAISLELGYSSVEHFSNAFKRYYSTSAREYRKRAVTQIP